MAYRKNTKPTQAEMDAATPKISIEMEDGIEVEADMPEEEAMSEEELQRIVAGEIDDSKSLS